MTLADEIELAQRYLAIEQVRFGERLRSRWELDAAADRARVPPLLLQPLVENAVDTASSRPPTGGTMRVRTRLRRGHGVITVVNSLPQRPSQPGPWHGAAQRARAAAADARRAGAVRAPA